MNNPKRPTERQRVAAGVQAMEQNGDDEIACRAVIALQALTGASLNIADTLADLLARNGILVREIKAEVKAATFHTEKLSNYLFRQFLAPMGAPLPDVQADLIAAVQAGVEKAVNKLFTFQKSNNNGTEMQD